MNLCPSVPCGAQDEQAYLDRMSTMDEGRLSIDEEQDDAEEVERATVGEVSKVSKVSKLRSSDENLLGSGKADKSKHASGRSPYTPIRPGVSTSDRVVKPYAYDDEDDDASPAASGQGSEGVGDGLGGGGDLMTDLTTRELSWSEYSAAGGFQVCSPPPRFLSPLSSPLSHSSRMTHP